MGDNTTEMVTGTATLMHTSTAPGAVSRYVWKVTQYLVYYFDDGDDPTSGTLEYAQWRDKEDPNVIIGTFVPALIAEGVEPNANTTTTPPPVVDNSHTHETEHSHDGGDTTHTHEPAVKAKSKKSKK